MRKPARSVPGDCAAYAAFVERQALRGSRFIEVCPRCAGGGLPGYEEIDASLDYCLMCGGTGKRPISRRERCLIIALLCLGAAAGLGSVLALNTCL